MGFSRQEYWSGLPFPSPGDLPSPGVEPKYHLFPALPADSLWLKPPEKPASSTLLLYIYTNLFNKLISFKIQYQNIMQMSVLVLFVMKPLCSCLIQESNGDVRAIWLWHLSPYWLPGLTWLIWLARPVSPFSLTAPCMSLRNLSARSKRMTIPERGGPVFGQGYMSSCAPLLEPPNKLSRNPVVPRINATAALVICSPALLVQRIPE